MVKADGLGSSKAAGDEAEALAWQYLQRQGLALVCRNYRVARGPHARGGEIDLIVRDAQGTLIFVEVRARAGSRFGGASASVTSRKQQRIVLAARHFLQRYRELPPCRFDVVAIDGVRLQWIQAAFDVA
jgi:putative endonuclease